MIQKFSSLFVLVFIFAVPFAMPQEARETGKVFPPQAVIIAAYRGDVEMLKQILATNPDKDVRDALGATALHAAMYQSNIQVVKLLLENGFDPNARDTNNNYTPLHYAVTANNLDYARLLLQYGANKSAKGLDKLTPLDKARKEEKKEMASLLYR